MELTYILIDFENVHPQDLDLLFGQQYRVKVFHGPHQNKLDVSIAKALQPLGEHVEYIQSDRPGKNAVDFHVAFWIGRHLQMQESLGRRARFVVISKDGGFDSLLCHVRSLGYVTKRAVTIHDALQPDELVDACAKPMSATSPPSSLITQSDSTAAEKVVAGVPVTTPAAKKTAPSTVKEGSVGQPVASKKVPTTGSGSEPVKPISPGKVPAGDVEKVIEHLRKHAKNRPAKRLTLERHILTLLGGKVLPAAVQAVVAKLEHRGIVDFGNKQIKYKLPNK